MEGKRFIHKIKLQNFLSYGSEGEEIELQPLNVLIGANASGKSNLIEAFEILRATSTDLPSIFRRLGGVSEILWKGNRISEEVRIQATIYYDSENIDYVIDFSERNQRFLMNFETICHQELLPEVIYLYNINSGKRYSNFRKKEESGEKKIYREDWDDDLLKPNQSILSQIPDRRKYPEIAYLSDNFKNIGIYRDLPIGRYCEPRKPQQTDLPEYPLLENGSNLGLVLNDLKYRIGNKKIIEKLKKFYDAAEEIDVRVYGGTVQIFIREEGLSQPIPATRLSDGTLRYLFLMALLLDPTPPPLICLEEPEIGLHPDILPTIAEMLIEASKRTQLIVTTHSDALISSLPIESILVCEKDHKGTHLRRLEHEKLKDWLENYTIGDLWRMGEIGGNRW